MIKIIDIQVEDMDNAGCNNGNYPTARIVYTGGKIAPVMTMEVQTCGCHKGCHGLACLPTIGQTFKSFKDLNDWVYPVEEEA